MADSKTETKSREVNAQLKSGKRKQAGSGKDNARLMHHLLAQMIRIRRLEEKSYELYTREKIRGFLHLYDGQEAVAVGVMEVLEREDAVIAAYREHGQALAKGVSMNSIMAEMYGKTTGCSGGRGGSMHLYDKETNFFGGSAIVANGLPMAVGLAQAYKMQKRSSLACCFFGDGAVGEGEFHESMNLASLWELPVLFVCENNLYSMGMPFELAEAETDLLKKAASYRVEGERVDGMDVTAVLEAARKAVDYIRSESKPWFLECQTYRFRAHSMFDPERYRDKSEVKEWKKRDPIKMFSERLMDEGLLDEKQLADIESQAQQEVEESVGYAEESSDEPIETLSRYVYSDMKNSE